MTGPGITAIRITKGSKTFTVHGDGAGEEGVWLAKGQVQGLYDAPVKSTWKTGAFQAGSTQRAHKFEHRDLILGFHISDTSSSWEFNDSEFRRCWDYEEDPWDDDYEPTILEVETELSGVRRLDLLMHKAPDFEAAIDPQMQQHGNVILNVRAGQPFWYSDDIVSNFTGGGNVTYNNPSDQIAYHKWILSPGTWAIPDFEWSGPKGARVAPSNKRTVPVTIESANGGAVIDLDRNELMFRDANNTNLLGQLAGKFFEYPIPPYTPSTSVSVTGPSGVAGQLRIPQRWSRPWGLEWPTSA